MRHEKLEGAPIPSTLAEIEWWRDTQKGLVRSDYFAGKRSLIKSCHLIEDINRAADKAREVRVNAVLYRRGTAA